MSVTLLIKAIEKGDYYQVDRLLPERGELVNQEGPSPLVGGKKITPLHEAVWQWNVEITRLLLEKGAEVNQKCNDITALHLACGRSYCNAKMLRLLLAHGADANAHDTQQSTPLHYAAINCLRDGVEILLADKRTCADAVNNKKKTAYIVAGCEDIKKLIRGNEEKRQRGEFSKKQTELKGLEKDIEKLKIEKSLLQDEVNNMKNETKNVITIKIHWRQFLISFFIVLLAIFVYFIFNYK